MEPLSARVVSDAVVYPVLRRREPESEHDVLLMGVFDANGDYVERTVTDRRSGERGAPLPREEHAQTVDDEPIQAVYAGKLHMHFGHFILESAARLWWAAAHPDVEIVWTAEHDWQDESFRPWQREILDILGVRNPIRFITRPTRFRTLHVPDIGYRYDDWIHPDHARFLAQHRGPSAQPGRRLWLSRGAIDSGIRDLGSDAAERHLRAAGWTVVNPERMSVREQLDQISRAEVIGGEEGSAFHAILLLADVGARRFEVVRRRGPEHRNFRTIGEARDVDQRFHSLAGERILHAEGRDVTKLSRSAVALLDALEVPRALPLAPRAGDRAAAAIARERKVQRLLEVGARTAFAAASSGARTVLVVSTRLEEDPRAYRALDGRVDELPLARYRELFVETPGTYDLIRIAGETAEEVLRDVDASAEFATADTVWVLDDDAAGREAAAALREREGTVVRHERAGGETAWTVARG
ncbi:MULTISPECIES: glycosyltransferase family 61 protein [unclassified Microbacterium]|uniref:glycosyltransferase family 61 protein n=1 Tax=Microbacterium TaxID=33882 RepID=UPI003BA0F8E6